MKLVIFSGIFLFSMFSFATTSLGTQITGPDVLTGKELSLTYSKAKKGTVVVFVSAKCPCSASHEALISNLANTFKDFNFVGVHSNADERMSEAKTHFEKNPVTFPIIQDSNNKLANQFEALKTPHAFVVSPTGEILYHGGVTDSHVGPSAKRQFLKEVLEDINAGKKPRVNEGRALGCFIQRVET